VHKDYRGCNPIQISVYEDKIYIYNDGIMPANLNTTEKLFEKHSSKPFNPKLAQVFFKSGMIEAWGRGFDKIREACAKYNNAPLPEYDISETGVMVLCKPCERYLRLLRNGESAITDERTWLNMVEVLSESERANMSAVLDYLINNDTIDNAKGRELTGKSATTVRRYFQRLCDVGLIKQTGRTSDMVYKRTVEHG
jgi:ATP-dependent DNA helicase RecG